MNCNLVKKVTKKTINGEEKSYTNYYLVFDNGKVVSIMARYIPTVNIKDAKLLTQVEKSNTRNALSLDLLADLVKNEK